MQSDLSRVVDALPGLVWTARPDGHVDFLNRRWLEYTGLRAEDARGHGWQAAIHPDDLPALSERWRRLLASGEPAEIEARFRRHDGAYRRFILRARPLVDASGCVVKWCGVNTDVEDRWRAEALLAGEQPLLEMIACGRSLPDVLDTLCRFVETAVPECHCGVYPIDWSGPAFLYGVAPSLPVSYLDPIEGLPVRCDVAPCGIAAHEKIQVIAEDIESDPRWCPSPFRDHLLDHGLRSVWSTPVLSRERRVLGTFCIYHRHPARPTVREQEIIARATHIASIALERAHAEASLRRSEALLAEGQRLSRTGTFSWYVVTNEIKWSDECYRIFEVAPSTPVTLGLIEARVHPEDAPAFAALLERARRRGGDVEFELRLRMADGAVKYLHLSAHATRHRRGRFEYIGAIQDVTERHVSDDALGKLRSALADVARVASLGALTASIAHEVNQPLAGIITNASTCLRMLDARPADIDGARETARRTIRDGHRASEVISRLRAMFGRQEPTSEQVDLNAATREVIALSMSELQRSRVVLQTALADDLPAVWGDRVQLQQVILNLLLNASEAMSEVMDRPRRLSITTERDGSAARLTVRDVGVGFDPRAANRLFDAFYTTKDGGMGIGLSISRSIIESHRGRMWAEANEGAGATFAFCIPCASERATGVHGVGFFWLPTVSEAAQALPAP